MHEFMERLFTLSLQAGVLILALLLIGRLSRAHVSPRLRYALWLLPALRLLLPFTFASRLSMMNLVQPDAAAAGPIPLAVPAAQPVLLAPDTAIANAIADAGAAMAAAPGEAAGAAPELMTVLFMIWALGTMLILGYMLFVNLRFYRRVHRERIPLDIPGETAVYAMAALSSPCLCGFFRPYILLNDAALAHEDALELALRHELCHQKQGDQLWNLMRSLCCALHWFNPLVWWAAARSRKDCELACDARVMESFSQAQCESYGMALLGVIRAAAPAPLIATTAMTGDFRTLRERIGLIGKRPRALAWATLTVLLLSLAAGLMACSERAAPTGYAESLYAHKTAYIGDNAKVSGLLGALEFPEALEKGQTGIALETTQPPYRLIANFQVSEAQLAELKEEETALCRNAMVLLALVDNLDELEFNITHGERADIYQFGRPWADYLVGGDVRRYGGSADSLRELLAMEPYILTHNGYIAMRMQAGSLQAVRANPMNGQDNALCHAIVSRFTASTDTRSGALAALPPCYVLREITTGRSVTTDYYVYIQDGLPVMQQGETGPCKPISREDYNAVAELLGDAGIRATPALLPTPMPTPAPTPVTAERARYAAILAEVNEKHGTHLYLETFGAPESYGSPQAYRARLEYAAPYARELEAVNEKTGLFLAFEDLPLPEPEDKVSTKAYRAQAEALASRWMDTIGALEAGTLSGDALTLLLDNAEAQLGKPYALNAQPPESFDAALLIHHCLNGLNGAEVRTCAELSENEAWARIGDLADARPGDLLFFTDPDGNIGHAGIYMGNGEMIHASSSSGKVIRSTLSTPYWQQHFAFARRIW